MSIEDINHRVINELEIAIEFPEYNPNFPHDINKCCNLGLISSFSIGFTDEFCNAGRNYHNIFHDGFLWSALLYPFADEHKLKNLIKLVSIFFFIDDIAECNFSEVARSANKLKPFAEMCCRLLDNIADIRKIPINEIQTWKPFMFALYSTLYAIREETSGHYWKYTINELKKYLMSLIKESEIEDQTYVVDEAEMLEFRISNSCGMAFLCLIQYSDGIELTEKELNDPLLQDVFKYAVKSMQMCNDLYSFRKEIKECNGMLQNSKNMIAIQMRTQSLSLQEAFDKQVVIIKKMDDLYGKARRSLLDSNPSAEVVRLCPVLDISIGGNWIYHLGAKRYNGANFKGCIPSNGKWIYSPHQTIIIPANDRENKFEKFQKYFRF